MQSESKKKRFIIVGIIIVLLVAGFFLFFSSSRMRWIKDLQSEYGRGLDRTIKIYDYSGNLLHEYSGKIDLDSNTDGGKIKFDLDGKRIIVYNAIAIVEEQ